MSKSSQLQHPLFYNIMDELPLRNEFLKRQFIRLTTLLRFGVNYKLAMVRERQICHVLQKVSQPDYRIAILIDSEDGKKLLKQLFLVQKKILNCTCVYKDIKPLKQEHDYAEYDSNWSADVDVLFLLRLHEIDSDELLKIQTELKSLKGNLAIFDQGALFHEFTSTKRDYKFRAGVTYKLNPRMLIPSYYYNDLYIDCLLNLIQENEFKSMMDMCTGSGCIGITCAKESGSLRDLLLVDIFENDIESVNKTIATNNVCSENVSAIVSDCFENVSSERKYDLISGNPPFANKEVKTKTHIKGVDCGWDFHKKFFSQADQYLNPNGVICLIESKVHSDVALFEELLTESNQNLELYEHKDLVGTEFFLIYIRHKR